MSNNKEPEYRELSTPEKVTLGDGRCLDVVGKGTVELKMVLPGNKKNKRHKRALLICLVLQRFPRPRVLMSKDATSEIKRTRSVETSLNMPMKHNTVCRYGHLGTNKAGHRTATKHQSRHRSIL